jgi:hypothetical protein
MFDAFQFPDEIILWPAGFRRRADMGLPSTAKISDHLNRLGSEDISCYYGIDEKLLMNSSSFRGAIMSKKIFMLDDDEKICKLVE